jgi:uncharacterized protein (DUF1800 family)
MLYSIVKQTSNLSSFSSQRTELDRLLFHLALSVYSIEFIALPLIVLIGIFLPFFLIFTPENSWAIDFPIAGDLTREQAAQHLLNRAAFGARPGEVADLSKPGRLEDWFQKQLYPEKIDDSQVQKKLETVSDLHKSSEQLSLGAPNTADEYVAYFTHVHEDQIFQKFLLAAESNRQLEQVMVDFWFNHFSVNGDYPLLLPSYENDVIRAHVFGKFKDMLLASAQHPVMLLYLDNWSSAKNGATTSDDDKKRFNLAAAPTGINENYARELMELHTLGANRGYTQKDVENVARIFTGWTVSNNRAERTFAFATSWHDQSDVEVMGKHFTGKDGVDEGRRFLQFLAAKEETAHFISEKLCRHFVQDPAPPKCIDRLSENYLKNDGDLRQLYLTLFTSPEFWDKKQLSNRMKKPFEFVASGLRAFGSDIHYDSKSTKDILFISAKSGEVPYHCSGPTGFSDTDQAWLNAATVITRASVAPLVVAAGHPTLRLNTESMVSQLSAPEFQRR